MNKTYLICVKPLLPFVAKNKVRIIYAGGTIGMLPGENGLEPGSNFAARLYALLDKSWLTNLNCQLDFCELNPLLDSSAMSASHWFSLAAQLLDEEKDYDAFILLQGTDTLAWTASALHCLLTNFSRPLILTASQLPLGKDKSDALGNFKFALQEVVQLNEGCFIAFADELLPAQTSRKFDTEAFKAFTSVSQPVKANVWPAGNQLTPDELRQLAANFNPNILRLPLTPNLNDAWISKNLEGLDGLILEGLGSGNSPRLPLTIKCLTELHQEKNLPIGLLSQCWQGGVNQNYAASAPLQKAGVLSLGKMTPEYAEARLVCLLALQKLNKITANEVNYFWFDN